MKKHSYTLPFRDGGRFMNRPYGDRILPDKLQFYFLFPHSEQNLAEASFFAPHSVQNHSAAGLGEPHSGQNLPVQDAPQAQVHVPAGAGLGEPHSEQNLPVLVWPQEQVQPFAGAAGAA
jgi:hypothetical protein